MSQQAPGTVVDIEQQIAAIVDSAVRFQSSLGGIRSCIGHRLPNHEPLGSRILELTR